MAVVGGGAAGLTCGVAAARLGLPVVVIEKSEQAGRKLALSGGRKANFTHAESPRHMADRFDCAPTLILSLLRRFPYQRITRFFESLGVGHRVDESGCVWPTRTDAAGGRDALVQALSAAGGTLRTGAAVTTIDALPASEVRGPEPSVGTHRSSVFSPPSFSLSLADGSGVDAARVLLATGGASYARTGSSGDGLALAARLGLATTPWFPALASLKTRHDFHALAGISQPLVRMALALQQDGVWQVRREAEGHFIFAHEFVSGSSVLNLSGFAARALQDGLPVELRVDWAPGSTRHEIERALAAARTAQPRARLTTVMARWVSRRLAEHLCSLAQVDPARIMAAASRGEVERAAASLKQTALAIVGTEPIDRATVTGGGVRLDEIDLSTMEARRLPGLYCAGAIR